MGSWYFISVHAKLSAMRRTAIVILLLTGACSAAPSIPHEVSQTQNAWCLTCHLDGVNEAPITPHPERLDCVACHRATGTADVGALGTSEPPEISLSRP